MSLRVLAAAELEAIEAAAWYDDQLANLGDEFVHELSVAFDGIRTAPLAFARLEHFDGPDEVRRCLVNRFPYLSSTATAPKRR